MVYSFSFMDLYGGLFIDGAVFFQYAEATFGVEYFIAIFYGHIYYEYVIDFVVVPVGWILAGYYLYFHLIIIFLSMDFVSNIVKFWL